MLRVVSECLLGGEQALSEVDKRCITICNKRETPHMPWCG